VSAKSSNAGPNIIGDSRKIRLSSSRASEEEDALCHALPAASAEGVDRALKWIMTQRLLYLASPVSPCPCACPCSRMPDTPAPQLAALSSCAQSIEHAPQCAIIDMRVHANSGTSGQHDLDQSLGAERGNRRHLPRRFDRRCHRLLRHRRRPHFLPLSNDHINPGEAFRWACRLPFHTSR
jgi:hypothetical protein